MKHRHKRGCKGSAKIGRVAKEASRIYAHSGHHGKHAWAQALKKAAHKVM